MRQLGVYVCKAEQCADCWRTSAGPTLLICKASDSQRVSARVGAALEDKRGRCGQLLPQQRAGRQKNGSIAGVCIAMRACLGTRAAELQGHKKPKAG